MRGRRHGNHFYEYLKNRLPDLDPILDTGKCVVCGIVLAELIHGVKSDDEKIYIIDALSEFQWLSIGESL